MPRRILIPKKCPICNKVYDTYYKNAKTCSKKCMGLLRMQDHRTNCTCLTCSKIFSVTLSDIKVGRGKYCSRACSGKRPKKWNKEDILSMWNIGLSVGRICTELKITSREAVKIFLKEKGLYVPRKSSGTSHYMWTYGKEYRRKALKILGNACIRCGFNKVPEILQVHHIDRNRRNNIIENLEPLCPNCHEIEHLQNEDGRYKKSKKQKIP